MIGFLQRGDGIAANSAPSVWAWVAVPAARLAWVAIGAAAIAACADRSTIAQARVIPTVFVQPGGVRPGSPVLVTYRFRVPASQPGFAERYRVSVEFPDADGETLFSDDHRPPVATTRWRPGDAVTYSRMVWVPNGIEPGRVRVRIRLMTRGGYPVSLTSDGEGEAAEVGGFMVLDDQGRSRPLSWSGWHPQRSARPGVWIWGVDGRWTTGLAQLSFRNPRRDGFLHLRLAAKPGRFSEPQTLEVLVGGTSVARLSVPESADEVHAIPLEPDLLGSDPEVAVGFRVDRLFARGPGGTGEKLGARILYAEVVRGIDIHRLPNGLGEPETDATGVTFRRAGRRVMFYGPTDARRVEIALRSPDSASQAIRVSLNGRAADEVVLVDDRWAVRGWDIESARDGMTTLELLRRLPEGRVRGELSVHLLVGEPNWRR